ncbi:sentrin-specific protease 7 [Gastrophryne carolinensis]
MASTSSNLNKLSAILRALLRLLPWFNIDMYSNKSFMMDKQKSNSPPFTQANRMTPGFKIPKKKPDDWCEEKEVTSPLAKLPDNDFRNVTSRRRKYGSSYEDYNVPRNKNSHAYYASSDNSRYNRYIFSFSVSTMKNLSFFFFFKKNPEPRWATGAQMDNDVTAANHATVTAQDHSSHSEDAVAEPIQSESSVLQLQFLNVYFGKKRGTSTDSSKFTVESIEIPMRVPLCRSTCLTIETRKLQKYGLWLTNGADSIKSNAVIILWITPDYAPEIEKQMQLPSINQASKLHEYIFLELAVPLTSKEQSLLCDIMKQASKHGLTTLAEAFTWDEMYSLLEHLPTEDCYFKSNCYTSAASQPPEAKKVKSNYTLVQKWTDGCYSVSMVPVQSSILKETLKGGTPIRLLVYPPPPTKGGLPVSSEDLECLEDGEFLNDVIIDFYLKYLMLEKFTKPFASSCHIFSSFFFKCLTRGEGTSNDNNSGLTPAERRHQRVKTWTRHVDIFKKDFIFVPVNENAHWYLAVICFPWLEKAVYEDKKEQNSAVCSKTGGYSSNSSVIVFNQRLSKAEEAPGDEGSSGSEGSSSSEASSSVGQFAQETHLPGIATVQAWWKLIVYTCLSITVGVPMLGIQKALMWKQGLKHAGKVCKRPCILIFDSLKTGTVQSTVKVLREYLNVEYRVKQKTEREFSRSSMRDLHPKVPKQNNSTDCGLYLLQYVESFSQKPIDNFEPPMRLENWFPSCVINNKREEIRDLILRLHLQQAKKS